ncbi:hypothetical protein [Rhodanobacter lindaniclasticus]
MLTSVGAGTLDYSAYTTAVNVRMAGTATNTIERDHHGDRRLGVGHD